MTEKKSKSVWDIMREGDALAERMAELFRLEADQGLTDEVKAAAEGVRGALEEYESDLAAKYLRVDFAKKHAQKSVEKLKEQVATFQRVIKSYQRTIERCTRLGVDIFESRRETLGIAEDVPLKLPDDSKAWMVRKDGHAKPVWAQRNEALLPDDVKEPVLRVNRDLLLQWAETATPLLDDRGEPVVTIEWVDGTHTRRK